MTVSLFTGIKFVICRLTCLKGKQKLSHYHCVCGVMSRLKSAAKAHAKKCPLLNRGKNKEIEEISSKENKNDLILKPKQPFEDPVPSTSTDKSTSTETQQKTNTHAQLFKKHPRLKCHICQQYISKVNISRHTRTHKMKKKDSSNTCCVDAECGIFLVQGVPLHSNPIHVKLKPYDPNAGFLCTNSECQQALHPAMRGKQNFLCEHLSSVINIPCIVKGMEIPPISLPMSSDMKTKCMEMRRLADSKGAPLIVKWPHSSSSRQHFSVFTGTTKSWSPLGRVLLTITEQGIHCPCAGSKHNCVHKAIIRWVTSNGAYLDTCLPLPSDEPTRGNDQSVAKGEIIADEMLSDWNEYRSSKKIDPETFIDFSETVQFDNLIPDELNCPWCGKELLNEVANENATIVDQHFIKTGKCFIYFFTQQCSLRS